MLLRRSTWTCACFSSLGPGNYAHKLTAGLVSGGRPLPPPARRQPMSVQAVRISSTLNRAAFDETLHLKALLLDKQQCHQLMQQFRG